MTIRVADPVDHPLTTTVVIPTLWRPHQIAPFLDALYTNAGSIPIRPVFLVQEDDEATLIAVARAGVDMLTFPADADGLPATMVAKCNAACAQVTTPFFFGASDDIRLLPGCLEAAHEALTEPGRQVACVSDGIHAHQHGGELTGHCLVRTSYIRERSGVLDEPNMVMHPGYFHFYSDIEFWQTGKARGVYVSCHDARIDHPHPNAGTAERDRVHDLSIRYRRRDAVTFRQRAHLWQNLAVPA